MRKKANIMSLIALLVTAVACGLFALVPTYIQAEDIHINVGSNALFYMGEHLFGPGSMVHEFGKLTIGPLLGKVWYPGQIGEHTNPIAVWVTFGIWAAAAIYWLAHFITLCVKKRGSALFNSIAWAIVAVVTMIMATYGIMRNSFGIEFNHGIIQQGYYDILAGDPFKHIVILVPFLVAALAFILGGVSIIMSYVGMKDVIVTDSATDSELSAEEVVEEPVEEVAEEVVEEVVEEPIEEVAEEVVEEPVEEVAEEVVEEPVEEVVEETPVEEPVEETPAEEPAPAPAQAATTVAGAGTTIIQNFYYGSPAPVASAPVAPAPVSAPVEEVPEDKPLTAKELREIIKKALDDHDHPENDLPLNDEEARELIRHELSAYYAGQKAAVAEPTPAPVAAPSLTAEEVRDIIRREMAAAAAPAVDAEYLRGLIADAFASQSAAEAAKESEKASVEAAQNAAIRAIAESLVSPEQIRAIVAAEVEKVIASFPSQEEDVVETPVETVAEPVAEVVPEQVVEPNSSETKVKYERKTFAERMLEADEEIISNYNDLKSYLLAYGLKSRLSNSGDTFRLSCETYVKITIAGKALKLYYALDPMDYVNSTIPVVDASEKNIYKDIPLCFKVKSPLSLKRAKQLIDACCSIKHGDNAPLEQAPVSYGRFMDEIRAYKPQLGGDDDEE